MKALSEIRMIKNGKPFTIKYGTEVKKSDFAKGDYDKLVKAGVVGVIEEPKEEADK